MDKKRKDFTLWRRESKWWLIGSGVTAIVVILIITFLRNLTLVTSNKLQPLRPTEIPVPTFTDILPDESASSPDYVEQAMIDLANKLSVGVGEGNIDLIAMEPREWSDTSLGCPERGMFYAQVITPGYIIELSAGGKTYIYHAGSNRVVTCPRQT